MRRTCAAMEPLDWLREKIGEFPGYDTHVARRHSDEYVRSYLGEALTDLAVRCRLSADVQSRLDALVLRVAFADPRAFSIHDGAGAADGSHDGGGAVAAADMATVEAADRAATLDCSAVPGYFDSVTALLDERNAALRAAAAKIP
jgi:hypothetical protein